ncbi:choice-of-anchor D domain-containing protein [Aquimarina sp. ERC-38]|uniref:Ig-like domain-containing protein n=1 Tax=Aquimarina sp. ERC-38 TaxID=2949996 RepID=UPI002248577A|nr:choice-of-anchor D domain-containing protein [Aquimarina sp. ERC-38]UZO81571.1 choice-of-anchor D domain-containing protein [Aquimarina sp. ERC-38]
MNQNFYLGSLLRTTQFLKRWGLLLLLISSFSYVVKAQQMRIEPGVIVTCPADFEAKHTKHGIPEIPNPEFRTKMKKNATAEFIVTFGPGALANPEAQAAFEFALDIWANEIVSSVPIRVTADFASFANPRTLAAAGPTYVVDNFPNAPVPDVIYPAALANAIAGEVLDPNQTSEFRVSLGDAFNWYFGTDGNPGPGQFDFVTVALHEIGHGLGFVSIDNVAGGVGRLFPTNLPNYAIFSEFTVNGDGERITSFPTPSTELGDQLTSNDLFIDGPLTVAALGGNPAKIFAPNPYQGGSSISHWDEATFPAGDPNSLMSPQVGQQESNFDIGAITRGFFRDMGWVVNDVVIPPLSVDPDMIEEELFVGEELLTSIALTNQSEETLQVTGSIKNGSSFIDFTDDPMIEIAASTTDSLQVTLNTTNAVKGIVNDTIVLTISGIDDPLEIPVSLRILDGTEAPIISVDPESFEETLIQNTVLVKDLTIQNQGDAPLTFNISVQDEDGIDVFPSQVAKTQSFIKENGFQKVTLNQQTSGNSMTKMVAPSSNSMNQIATSLYATDFEDFTPGNINGQMGWLSRFDDNWIISDENAKEGSLHFRGISDGLGTRLGAIPLAVSPIVTPFDDLYTAFSADININSGGNTWEVIPQSVAEQLIVTSVIFNPDNTIDILNNDGADGELIRIPQTTPEGYFKLLIEVSGPRNEFQVFFDDELVFTGIPFASFIDQVALISDMIEEGGTLDMDNVEITDFNEDAFFVSVAPEAGSVAIQDSTTVNVIFNSRDLDPGTYMANLEVTSNDADNSPIDIPITMTVVKPPTISVSPDSLSVAINVETDNPAIKTEILTITNSGQSPLEYNAAIGESDVQFAAMAEKSNKILSQLNLKDYGVGSTGNATLRKSNTTSSPVANLELKNLEEITDSIFYDSGVNVTSTFVGSDDATRASSTAVRFDVEEFFTLTAIRNAFRTEDVEEPVVILEIYKGGTNPNEGELLLTQAVEQTSEEGIFALEELIESLQFKAGESFWVVHKYPVGILFPAGFDENGMQREGANLFSLNGGTDWDIEVPDDFIFLNRALGTTIPPAVLVEPANGTVAPGATEEVTVTFNATGLANGTYNTPIGITSNDPVTPEVIVPTTLEVTGQTNNIVVEEEVLFYNNVFVGNQARQTVTIINDGLGTLTIAEISTDNDDFTVFRESAVIGAKDSLSVTVTFNPSSVGSINGILSIISDDADTPLVEVILNGVGEEPSVAVLSPDRIEETLESGSTTTSTVTLSNEGNTPLVYSFPEVAAANLLSTPGIVLNNTSYINYATTNETKGAVDSRAGHNVILGAGRDDAFGYRWIDNNEIGGPVYNFQDITSTGEDITLDVGGDDTFNAPLNFSFEFYGTMYTNVNVHANGFLSFNTIETDSFINRQIPVDDAENNIISVLWDDLEPLEGEGSVHYQSFEDRLIVQWTNTPRFFFPLEETVTFQVVLYSDGNIDMFYQDVSTASFRNSTTVGIENADGSDGIQVAFNTDYIENGLAVRFIKPALDLTPFITEIDNISGVIAVNRSRNFEVTLDATNLTEGVYFDELRASTNSIDKSRSTVLFELTVVEDVLSVDTNVLTGNAGFTVNNPVSELAKYQIGTQKSNALQLSLMTLTGQQVYGAKDFTIDASGKGSLDVSALSKGIYLLILSDADKNVLGQRKIVKK